MLVSLAVPSCGAQEVDFCSASVHLNQSCDRMLVETNYLQRKPNSSEATMYTAESLVAGIVDMANVYSADPRIQQLGLVTLSDPLGLFLASNVVPIASEAVNADARALIDAVSAAMSAEDLVALNVRSVDEKLSAAVIAREWLVSEGLLD
jgi:glycine betaine/choline ABC-type transport system substrate-binding protein